jgi:hypothetical protein
MGLSMRVSLTCIAIQGSAGISAFKKSFWVHPLPDFLTFSRLQGPGATPGFLKMWVQIFLRRGTVIATGAFSYSQECIQQCIIKCGIFCIVVGIVHCASSDLCIKVTRVSGVAG